MRRKRTVPPSTVGVNITALCDIMLSLLIFFMLVSKKGIDTGADPDIALPQTLQGSKIEDFGNTITLNVYPGGLDEPEVTTLQPATGELVTLRITEPGPDGTLTRPLQEFLMAVRSKNENLKVIIRAGEELDYRFLEPVLLASAEARVANVNFATRTNE